MPDLRGFGKGHMDSVSPCKRDLLAHALRKRARARQLERLAKQWENLKYLPFVDFRRRRRKVREFKAAAREQRGGALVLEGQAAEDAARAQ